MLIPKKLIGVSLMVAAILASNALFAAPPSKPAKEVEVVNTPDVNVANSPDVNVANTVGVDVLNWPNEPAALDDYVSLRVSGEFSDGSCCLIDPATGFVSRLDIGQFNGRDLLIEYVSCQVLIPPTQAVNLYIGENGQDAPVDMLIAIELSEQYSALADDSLFGSALHASQPVMIIVDSEDDLLLNGRREVGSSGVGRASCVVAGRLVN